MYGKIAAIQFKNANVIIKPKAGHIGSDDFTRRHEVIMEGERAAVKAMPIINQIIAKLRQEGWLQQENCGNCQFCLDK